MVRSLAVIVFVFAFAGVIATQSRQKMQIEVTYLEKDRTLADLLKEPPPEAKSTLIDTYWNGEKAPEGRTFEARLFWSDAFLYVLFEARQAEPLVIADSPVLGEKAMNLWDRDVCEIFVAPNAKEPGKYFEFEIAPNGEWLDVAIDATGKERKSEWSYRSGMQAVSTLGPGLLKMGLRIPWEAFARTPKAGDVWLGNLLRCIGKDPDRGYLAWSPTMTKTPDFHVPDRFGEFKFKK